MQELLAQMDGKLMGLSTQLELHASNFDTNIQQSTTKLSTSFDNKLASKLSNKTTKLGELFQQCSQQLTIIAKKLSEGI